eukprot:TRINITY_DN1397_c0_g1_i2.p1 TRINITY_DN1397_c0_g1~~TRINITY_DN1397_c0_g1_i2.p1  ORF type:complete len:614 (+),score=51.75 TRINITY_DN1397_c0_g1_i2:686-2527(+)
MVISILRAKKNSITLHTFSLIVALYFLFVPSTNSIDEDPREGAARSDKLRPEDSDRTYDRVRSTSVRSTSVRSTRTLSLSLQNVVLADRGACCDSDENGSPCADGVDRSACESGVFFANATCLEGKCRGACCRIEGNRECKEQGPKSCDDPAEIYFFGRACTPDPCVDPTAPTTRAPTTLAPTTLSPTTLAPTTRAPTTRSPTTSSPTTEMPTSVPTRVSESYCDNPAVLSCGESTVGNSTFYSVENQDNIIPCHSVSNGTYFAVRVGPLAATTGVAVTFFTDTVSELITFAMPSIACPATEIFCRGNFVATPPSVKVGSILPSGFVGYYLLRVFERGNYSAISTCTSTPTPPPTQNPPTIAPTALAPTTSAPTDAPSTTFCFDSNHVNCPGTLFPIVNVQLYEGVGETCYDLERGMPISSNAFDNFTEITSFQVQFFGLYEGALLSLAYSTTEENCPLWCLEEQTYDSASSGPQFTFTTAPGLRFYAIVIYPPESMWGLNLSCSAVAPTTVSPTTLSPTTLAPTTFAPTTWAPTTRAPTTHAPTTRSPTTHAPTTRAPTAHAPTTRAPTALAPTTLSPTTPPPDTEIPQIHNLGTAIFGRSNRPHERVNGQR